jgi:hypothetical protein
LCIKDFSHAHVLVRAKYYRLGDEHGVLVLSVLLSTQTHRRRVRRCGPLQKMVSDGAETLTRVGVGEQLHDVNKVGLPAGVVLRAGCVPVLLAELLELPQPPPAEITSLTPLVRLRVRPPAPLESVLPAIACRSSCEFSHRSDEVRTLNPISRQARLGQLPRTAVAR